VARWTLASPTSLAELPNHVTRRALPPNLGATLVRVSDEAAEDELNEAEEIAFLRATPVEVILANHLFVLLQLAALRLGETPPELPAAQLVIDTVRAILDATGERLGEHLELYRTALAELQQAYVRASKLPST
jgi:hypothetical protein